MDVIMADWTEKYRPNSLSDIYGNKKQVQELDSWISSWEIGGDAIVLHGPPGVGKTSAAHAAANDYNHDVVEVNASDKRTRADIEEFVGKATEFQNLGDDTKTVIVVDEADNLHGNHDRGGSKAITEIVKNSRTPVILIANDFYELSRTLRNNSKEIEFEYVDESEIGKALRDVCEAEGISYDFESLKKFASQSKGDVRSAINDLKALTSGNNSLSESESNITGERSQKIGIFPYLDDLFKQYSAEEAYTNAREVDKTPDEMLRWIKDNVYKVYDGDELADAYEFISNADVWLGRTYTTQEYKYWKYANQNLTAGVAASRTSQKGGWTRFGPPQYHSTNKTSDEVCRKIGQKAGTSTAIAKRCILPFLSALTHHCKPRELTVQMAAYYDLDEKEVSFVTGSGKTTNKVQDIVEDAKELQDEYDYTTPDEEELKRTNEQDSVEDDKTTEENGDTDEEEEDDDDEDEQMGIGEFM